MEMEMEMDKRQEQGDMAAELGRGFAEVFPTLGFQACRALSVAGVVTAEDLVALSREELLAVKYVGAATVAQIQSRVQKMGLALGQHIEVTAPSTLTADAPAPEIKIKAESVTVSVPEQAPEPQPEPVPGPAKRGRGARPERDTLRAAFEQALGARDWDEATRLQGLLAKVGVVVRFTKRHAVIPRGPESPRRYPPEPKGGPRCSKCGSTWLKVDHTSRAGKFNIRYRICRHCGSRVTTRERVVGKEKA